MRYGMSIILCHLFSVCFATQQGFQEWQNGDLIFQDSGSDQADAIRISTHSRYTHVGIIRLTSNGPVVVEAVGPVKETPLDEFISYGKNQWFAVYRLSHLTSAQAEQVLNAAKDYYGRPYDPFFRDDTESIYCSELIWQSFLKVGLVLGKQESFSSLNIHNQEVKKLFMSRWEKHPDCATAKNAQSCWNTIQTQKIVTPVSLAQDEKMMRIYSNFP